LPASFTLSFMLNVNKQGNCEPRASAENFSGGRGTGKNKTEK